MNEQVKSYSCRVCQKKFYHSSSKARHQSACGKDKAFHCLQCKRTFARKDARDRHMKLHVKAAAAGGPQIRDEELGSEVSEDRTAGKLFERSVCGSKFKHL